MDRVPEPGFQDCCYRNGNQSIGFSPAAADNDQIFPSIFTPPETCPGIRFAAVFNPDRKSFRCTGQTGFQAFQCPARRFDFFPQFFGIIRHPELGITFFHLILPGERKVEKAESGGAVKSAEQRHAPNIILRRFHVIRKFHFFPPPDQFLNSPVEGLRGGPDRTARHVCPLPKAGYDSFHAGTSPDGLVQRVGII